VLDRDAWRPLVHAHGAVQIIPPYGCVVDDDAPKLDQMSMDIQLIASEQALPINGTYSARELRNCAAEEQAWATLELQPDTLYVLLPQARAIADRFEARGAHCGVFDFGRVCSTNEAAIERAVRANILRRSVGPTTRR
jgi:hypothetical protein